MIHIQCQQLQQQFIRVAINAFLLWQFGYKYKTLKKYIHKFYDAATVSILLIL